MLDDIAAHFNWWKRKVKPANSRHSNLSSDQGSFGRSSSGGAAVGAVYNATVDPNAHISSMNPSAAAATRQQGVTWNEANMPTATRSLPESLSKVGLFPGLHKKPHVQQQQEGQSSHLLPPSPDLHHHNSGAHNYTRHLSLPRVTNQQLQARLQGYLQDGPRQQQQQQQLCGRDSDSLPSVKSGSLGATQEADTWAIPREDITVATLRDGTDNILGKGAFGTVYRATWKGVDVAVKQFNAMVDEEFMYALRKEFAVLYRVNNAVGIVGLLGYIDDPVAPAIVLEYCQGGDLRQALIDDNQDVYRWGNRGRSVAIQVLKALQFMHDTAGVIHRDVKASNVLLMGDGQAKLADVGLSKILSEAGTSSNAVFGTFAYAAPELLLGRRCTTKVDIYSFGVLCYEICTKTMPIRGRFNVLGCTTGSDDAARVPPAVATCIARCLSDNPSDRPEAEQLLEMLMAT